MDCRTLGSTGIECSRLGWGAFKIGRDQGTKFPDDYVIPSEDESIRIIHGMLDMGINLIDTAPSYGLSEIRLGKALEGRRDGIILSTKVGERFENGQSHYDFSSTAAVKSLQESLKRLKTDHVDILWIHSDGNDQAILEDDAYVETLESLKDAGMTRAIGFSGKSVEGNRSALSWADAVMIEYHLQDRSHEPVILEAADRGIGVVVKKALRSGHLPGDEALRFVLHESPAAEAINSVIIGSIHIERMKSNLAMLS
ncbi:MAG: aldo/keto reductase [Phycisphaerae bacterium]|nr:aldo/keto reductase [Phycisphaerae bacterium]|tara:strand:+ start:1420 stop:2184 length:765 start_codon:yes stop_codon:yes gene_type:complete